MCVCVCVCVCVRACVRACGCVYIQSNKMFKIQTFAFQPICLPVCVCVSTSSPIKCLEFKLLHFSRFVWLCVCVCIQSKKMFKIQTFSISGDLFAFVCVCLHLVRLKFLRINLTLVLSLCGSVCVCVCVFVCMSTFCQIRFLRIKHVFQVSGFPVFTRSGEVVIRLKEIKSGVSMTEEQLTSLQCFHKFTFTHVLRLEKYPIKFDPNNAKTAFYIVPLNKCE